MRRLAFAACLAALAAGPTPAMSAPAVPPGAVVTNGPVRAIAVGRERVFFGGEFTRIGSYMGSNLRLDWTTGELRPGFAGTNGQVSEILADGSGGWYLAGGFDRVGGVTRTNLVHVRAAGSVNRNFNARIEGFVSTLALDGDRLYIGGSLSSVDGRERRGIALIDAHSGKLDTDFRYAGKLPVPELALSGEQSGGARRLYAQEYADFQGPQPLRAIDPNNGAVIPEFVFPYEARKVGALAVRGDTLYVGGGAGHYLGSEFGDEGPLVAVDGRTGAQRVSFDPEISGGGVTSIEDIELDGDRLVVGGRFEAAGSHTTAGVAMLNVFTGAASTGFEAGVSGRVADVALADGLVHAAVGERIVALDSSGGRAPLELPDLDGRVDALATQGGVLYAGGRFQFAGAISRNGLAALTRDGKLVAGFRPAAGPGPHAQLELAHGRLYVGDYRGIRGEIAALSPTSGRLLRGFSTPASSPVYDFAVGPDLVYGAVGGANRVLAFDANTGRRRRGFRIRTPGYVTDLDYARGRLMLAGSWDARGGRRGVVAVSGSRGRLLGGFNPRIDGEVQSLTASGRRLYVAGPFGGAALRLPAGGLDEAFRPTGMPRRAAELVAAGATLFARDTRSDRLSVFDATTGARETVPDWGRITAVRPLADGAAWYGAGLTRGKSRNTWFLARG